MKRTCVLQGLALAGALLLLAGCAGTAEYRTVRPERGAVEDAVTDTGTVSYRDPYVITPEVNGRILSCSFDEGDEVRAGDELYVIDSTDLEDQITQASLALDTARESYRQAAAAQGDLTVKSHTAGTVTAVYVHEGDFVSTGTPIAQVVDSARLTLTVPFLPADAAAIHAGDAAVISFPSFSDRLIAAVTRVYGSSTPLSGGREGVYVEFTIANPGALASGTLAMAEVGDKSSLDSAPVAYATEQSIYATQSGQVLTLPLEAGDTVSVGQQVMTIDNDSITNAVSSASLAVESAQVSLEQLEARREDYRVLAPADGIITSRTLKTGDFAAAANPMATLVEEDSMCVNAAIDELYISRVWPGQAARVTFTADSGEARTYAAQVRRVDDTGVTAGGITDYTVELTLEDTDGLKAGMNVDVSIITAEQEDCLRIPTEALSGNTVQVLRDGRAVMVEVTTGASSGGYTEITGGLTETDEVILP